MKELQAEIKRLRIIETAAQLYGDYCRERHYEMADVPMCFEEWLAWMLIDDILGDKMIHYDQETLDELQSKFTGRYERLYGKGSSLPNSKLEIVTFRSRAAALTPKPNLLKKELSRKKVSEDAHRTLEKINISGIIIK